MPSVIVAETVQISTEDPGHNKTQVTVAVFSRKYNASVNEKSIKWRTITVPVTIKFDLKYDIKSKYDEIIYKIKRHCFALRTNKTWTREGCTTLKENSTHVECSCNKTGIFTVFPEIESMTLPYSLELLYFVGGCLNACLLLATVSILAWYRDHLHTDRVYPQINLSISLFLYQCCVAFKASVNLMNPIPTGPCVLAAFFEYVFFLSSVYGVLVEGIILGMKMMPFLLTGILKRYLNFLLILAWFIPVVLSAIVIPICITRDNCMERSLFYKDLNEKIKDERTSEKDDEIHLILSQYKKYDYCWPNAEADAIFVKTISVGLVFIINTVILTAVSIIVWRVRNADKARVSNPCKNCYEHITNTLQAILILHMALGTPWLLTCFIVLNDSRVIETVYLHCVVNLFQGLIIFIVYCVLNKNLRRAVRRKLEVRNANSNSRSWILGFVSMTSKRKTNC